MLLRNEEVWDGAWSDPRLVYPSNPDGLAASGAPAEVLAAIHEAQTCLHASAFNASALMCRKALELVCASHGVQGTNLARSIQLLREQGVIDDRLYEWADALRVAGNEAAHDPAASMSGDDARDLLDLTRAILEYVIVVRDRFERYKQRRRPRPQP
jgi:Domain of unknown function (DUF4145)